VVCCPRSPPRPPCWRCRDLTAAEFGGVRHLKLLPPGVYVGLAHRECLVRCRFLAVRDAGELDVFAGQNLRAQAERGQNAQPPTILLTETEHGAPGGRPSNCSPERPEP